MVSNWKRFKDIVSNAPNMWIAKKTQNNIPGLYFLKFFYLHGSIPYRYVTTEAFGYYPPLASPSIQKINVWLCWNFLYQTSRKVSVSILFSFWFDFYFRFSCSNKLASCQLNLLPAYAGANILVFFLSFNVFDKTF